MQEHQLHDPSYHILMPEGQLVNHTFLCYSIGKNECFDDWGYHIYMDTSRHLQVSIVRSSINQLNCRNIGFFTQESPINSRRFCATGYLFPRLSLYDIEAITNALLSHGMIPEDHWTDKKACLLAIYDFAIIVRSRAGLYFPKNPTILISPMRRAKAARLTFDCEYLFEWVEWTRTETSSHVPGHGGYEQESLNEERTTSDEDQDTDDASEFTSRNDFGAMSSEFMSEDVETSHVTIKINSWTR